MKVVIGLSLAASLAFGAAQVSGQAAFPPPPPKVSPAAGVVDLHGACAASCSRTTSARRPAGLRW
jgi:hypothetical protein